MTEVGGAARKWPWPCLASAATCYDGSHASLLLVLVLVLPLVLPLVLRVKSTADAVSSVWPLPRV